MKKAVISSIIGAAVLATSPAALAYEAGDIIVRAGAASVQPDDSSTGALDAVNAKVGNDTQLGLTATYMLSNNVGVELLAATPFKHKIDLPGLNTAAETKHLPPTLSVQYFPMDAGSALQPYVGAGLNYTTFFSEDIPDGELKLKDSWGLAVQAGVDYAISENLILNAAVWHIDIDTKASHDTIGPLGTAQLDPWVYMVGVGYKF